MDPVASREDPSSRCDTGVMIQGCPFDYRRDDGITGGSFGRRFNGAEGVANGEGPGGI